MKTGRNELDIVITQKGRSIRVSNKNNSTKIAAFIAAWEIGKTLHTSTFIFYSEFSLLYVILNFIFTILHLLLCLPFYLQWCSIWSIFLFAGIFYLQLFSICSYFLFAVIFYLQPGSTTLSAFSLLYRQDLLVVYWQVFFQYITDFLANLYPTQDYRFGVINVKRTFTS